MTKRLLFPYATLLILIFAVYSNTFTAPWFFDDFPNIVNNPPLHLYNLMPESIWQTFFAQPFRQGNLYRPIACLSLALNWFAGQENTVGYHLVNTAIHYMAAIVLYLTVIKFFQTPRLEDTHPPERVFFVSLLTAVLWAVNPIQTQAVTYIVQRMASLAGMFYILSIYGYIAGRLQKQPRRQYGYFTLCLLSFFLLWAAKRMSFYCHSAYCWSSTSF